MLTLAFNDVMEVSEGISCSLYVDDFAIYVPSARLAGMSVGFRRKLTELSNGLILIASSFQLLKQKQFYFIINERWLVYLLLICMVN